MNHAGLELGISGRNCPGKEILWFLLYLFSTLIYSVLENRGSRKLQIYNGKSERLVSQVNEQYHCSLICFLIK